MPYLTEVRESCTGTVTDTTTGEIVWDFSWTPAYEHEGVCEVCHQERRVNYFDVMDLSQRLGGHELETVTLCQEHLVLLSQSPPWDWPDRD